MKKKIIVIFLIANYIFIIQACKKDKSNTEADNALYSEATSGTYTYYQNGTLLSAVSPSPHGSFKLNLMQLHWLHWIVPVNYRKVIVSLPDPLL